MKQRLFRKIKKSGGNIGIERFELDNFSSLSPVTDVGEGTLLIFQRHI